MLRALATEKQQADRRNYQQQQNRNNNQNNIQDNNQNNNQNNIQNNNQDKNVNNIQDNNVNNNQDKNQNNNQNNIQDKNVNNTKVITQKVEPSFKNFNIFWASAIAPMFLFPVNSVNVGSPKSCFICVFNAESFLTFVSPVDIN